MKMRGIVGTLVMIGLVMGLVDAEYRYYYPSTSYSSLCNKVRRLEEKIASLQQPVNVHVNGANDQSSLSADGTHIHVHLSLDGQGGVVPTAMEDEYHYATCKVEPSGPGVSSVRGSVHLRQKPSSKIEMKVELSGFPLGGQYGFHVHEVADFTNGCNSFGGHYNPYGKTHGGPEDTIRHVGDWGNLQVDSRGIVISTMTDSLASLFGKESIVGRGIVIHAGTDDLGRGGNEGSLKTGNAGARLACCAIGWAKGGPW